ncbi:MAG: helix-turn-helix transcriptional regulator [Nocardioidaceae bacterium]|nr:MAG: helix-turn-helix transcriptional regulator [Nocardioidaceae bacterium]
MGSRVDPAALRAAREDAGLTQHQLARLIGVAGGERVSRWELGLSEPRPDALVRLARVLHIRPLDLLDVEAGADLRALRFAAGFSADEAAVAAHVSKRTYVRWETGQWKHQPSPAQLKALATALRVRQGVALLALDRSRPDYSPDA